MRLALCRHGKESEKAEEKKTLSLIRFNSIQFHLSNEYTQEIVNNNRRNASHKTIGFLLLFSSYFRTSQLMNYRDQEIVAFIAKKFLYLTTHSHSILTKVKYMYVYISIVSHQSGGVKEMNNSRLYGVSVQKYTQQKLYFVFICG